MSDNAYADRASAIVAESRKDPDEVTDRQMLEAAIESRLAISWEVRSLRAEMLRLEDEARVSRKDVTLIDFGELVSFDDDDDGDLPDIGDRVFRPSGP